METSEFLGIIRDMIRHEDALRDQRLGWLFAMNGLLFAGLGFAWPDDDSGPLVGVLATVGVLVAISSAAALARSQRAIKKLDKLAKDQAPGAEYPPVIALRSKDLQDDNAAPRWVKASWLLPWRMLPSTLALAWFLVPGLWVFAR